MATITITTVTITPTTIVDREVVGEAVAQFKFVYFDDAAQNWKQADANTDEAHAGKDGIGLLLTEVKNANEYGMIAKSGLIYINTGLTEGRTYVLGLSGALIDDADANTGGYRKTVLGVAQSNSAGTAAVNDEFLLSPVVSGVVAS